MEKVFFSSCDSITTIFDSWAFTNLRFANGNDISASRKTPQVSQRQQSLVNNFGHEFVRLRVNTFWPVICPVSCEQLQPDEFEYGLEFVRSRVNVVSETSIDEFDHDSTSLIIIQDESRV